MCRTLPPYTSGTSGGVLMLELAIACSVQTVLVVDRLAASPSTSRSTELF